jgi:hypothetical protein
MNATQAGKLYGVAPLPTSALHEVGSQWRKWETA